MNYPSFLEKAFEKNYTAISDDTTLRFSVTGIGKINIKEGNIIACDPITLSNGAPFTEKFPTGNFPVELAIADIDTDERIGFSRIRFSDSAPLKWKMAVIEGQDPDSLEPGEIFGYAVDSGTGCLMDTSGYREYLKKCDNDDYLDIINDAIDKSYKDTRAWLMWESNKENAAFFSTGYGDGVFASYIGYDAGGKICRLVTDFGLIDWEES